VFLPQASNGRYNNKEKHEACVLMSVIVGALPKDFTGTGFEEQVSRPKDMPQA